MGADDYVTKPFSAAEVVARVGALIRRAEGRLTRDPASVPFMIDEDRQRIAWRGKWLDLSTFEYRILAAMMKQPGRVFSRDQLLDEAGDAGAGKRRSCRRHAHQEHPPQDRGGGSGCGLRASVYGSGYRFEGTS